MDQHNVVNDYDKHITLGIGQGLKRGRTSQEQARTYERNNRGSKGGIEVKKI